MEIAILIESEEEYKGKYVRDYHMLWGSDKNGLSEALRQVEKYKDHKIDYLYFGNEFCEYKIPSVTQLDKIISLCKKEDIHCVLVTPVVTDYGIERLSFIFDYLKENDICLEIVVNDVGVLELINRKKLVNKLIIGRVFDKTSHDSRASEEELDDYYGENGKRFAMTPGVLSQHSQIIYKQYGVERYEFDIPKIGITLPKIGDYSLYWPYTYLTTGRVCLLRSIDLKGRDKFLVGGEKCHKNCLKYKIEKRKPLNGYVVSENGKKMELFLFQRGNTVFFVNEDMESFMDKFNRLIIQL